MRQLQDKLLSHNALEKLLGSLPSIVCLYDFIVLIFDGFGLFSE